MNESMRNLLKSFRDSARIWIGGGIAVLLIGLGAATSDTWLPTVNALLSPKAEKKKEDKAKAPSDSLHVSEQAKRNIGLNVGDVVVRKRYLQKLTVPGMVVGLPGRTRFQIASPMTGIVTEIGVVRGQSITSEGFMFRLRLSHEDLVRAQTNFLRTLGELDAEKKEIARLKKVAAGAIAGRLILERQYARDKLQAVMRAQEEALHLHGLSDSQIESIRKNRRLVRELVVKVPKLHADLSLHFDRESDPHHKQKKEKSHVVKASGKQPPPHSRKHRFVVEKLPVQVGQAVKTGDPLAVLADYKSLYIEGWAFEQDADDLVSAANDHQSITAVPEGKRGYGTAIPDLPIVFVDNEVDSRSRALHFYVGLPNKSVRDVERNGRRFLTWKYRPGQRMQLRIPVGVWKDVIVLPVDAIAQEGPEYYVFVENGKEFVRRAVIVKYKDQFEAVIEYDGSISPGDRVAMNGAHQLLMALKNQAGSAVDPHAGHTH